MGGLIVVAIVALIIGEAVREVVFYHHRTAIVTVCDKERAALKDGNAEYRVYASDSTLVIKDTHALTQWRTDSADVYRQIHKGRTYKVTYVGYRWKFRSWFHNITGFEQLPTNELELSRCDN